VLVGWEGSDSEPIVARRQYEPNYHPPQIVWVFVDEIDIPSTRQAPTHWMPLPKGPTR
jgi:hypothetical protein